jgi:hypothetical protein
VSKACDCIDYHDRNYNNLLQSGRRFFGEIFGNTAERTMSFNVPNAVNNNGLKIKLSAAARSISASSFSVQVNGGNVYTMDIPPVNDDHFARDNSAIFAPIAYSGEKINVKITYSKPLSDAVGYLDFITINARSALSMNNVQLLFRDAESVAPSRITRFDIQSTQNNLQVWDVSNIHAVKRLATIANNNVVSIATPTERLKTFAAFAPAMAYTPTFVEKMATQNLQGAPKADYVIITPPSLLLQAQRLARLHKQQSGLQTSIVTTTQVYNEFSSGIPDPTAIRNYLKTKKLQGQLPHYVLLFGNGSYVNMEGKKGVGLIPTYQSDNSLVEKLSFVSDDYFTLLDTHDDLGDSGMTGKLDAAIGRLPAADAGEASIMVHKVERYYAESETLWANRLVMIADDEDYNTHVSQTEDLCNYVQDSFPAYSINKIYFDKYPQTMTTIGKRYPDATEAINSAVQAGALLVNYVGHANDQWLAHEKVVTQDDIAKWNNGGGKLPLFVTATCEFSRFDNYARKSAGEKVLLKANGGGVAMLSTTRLVYSNSNAALSRTFMKQLFTKDEQGQPLRLGEILRRTKNTASTGVNQLNFTLLGDPALLLHFPADTISNGQLWVNNIATDTLRALDKVKISGTIAHSNDGDTLEIAVFDKIVQKQTLGNGGQTPFPYQEYNQLIYKGITVVRNGIFTTQFIVPKDIQPAYGQGKITYFGKNGGRYVAGSTPVVVGGVNTHYDEDITPPDITLFIDNQQFVDGGMTTETPLFIALLSDSSGINATGSGIGRNMTLYLPGTQKTYVLNSYYTANADSYTAGRVEFPIPPLPKGTHTAVFKAFDVHNNSAERTIRFVVAGEPQFAITRLFNYPNPFGEQTTFFFAHNRPDAEMEVQIQIFTTTGMLIKTLQYSIYGSDTQLQNNFVSWDGRSAYGRSPQGIYFYKIKVKCKTGEFAEKVEKMYYLCR